MKKCIYVFSGTGTSLAAAQKIADQLGDTTVLLIPKALETAEQITIGAPIVGFVFPNYFGKMPQIVLDFIQRADFSNTEYIFSIVTGGAGHGRCFGQLRQVLEGKEKQLDYGKSILGLSNYIVGWYYKLVKKTGTQQEKALERLSQKAIEIAGDISDKKREVDKDQVFFYLISQILSSKKIIRDTRPWDRDFSIADHCTGCGTCSRVCQVHNLKMAGNTPEFGHNCQRCLACIHYCPEAAIYYRGKPLVKPRYMHPDYPAQVIIKRINSEN